ncbi:MAG TPA: ATP-binding protein [Myxococcales bacterium]|nr:ATP-binding protein [Myxococcales bacterium]
MLRSLRSRLLVAFLVPALALSAVSSAVGYVVSRRILEEELGGSLSAVAAAAAAQVSGDRLLSIEPGDDVTGTRTWRNLRALLAEVQHAAGARRAFAFDVQGRLRVDSGGSLPVGAEVPELFRDRLELRRVFEGDRAHSQVLFEGSDGQLYKTGYAPIRAGDQVVGAIGVEGSARFFGPLRSLLRGFIALGVAGLAVIALVALGTARTLTAPLRRLMAAALRIGQGDLQTEVPRERTLEIGTLATELEAMRRALEGRDRQLKMMLAGVAHEVRNPIGGIELFAGLLAEELAARPEDVEALGHVRRIRGEIEYLQRIVEEFLTFARDQRVASEPLEAEAVVEAAGRIAMPDAAAKQVRVKVEAAPATLHGDHALLVSAVGNLLKNAVQASPAGAEVRVRGSLQDARYRIEVEDAGAGVPPELAEKIFEPFYTTREKGTGLGLPLARKIAAAHHGQLTVSSGPGRTVFTLELPL